MNHLVSRIRGFALTAKGFGADICVLPEYFAMLSLDFAPDDLKESSEVPWMAEELISLRGDLFKISREIDIAILAGTWPTPFRDKGYRNTAYLQFSKGEYIIQPKLHLTNEEMDRMGWYLKKGNDISPFDFKGKKCGICICHDTVSDRGEEEWRKEKVELLFVPSMTEMEGNVGTVDSHAYIFEHARKRSKQLNCAVVAVGAAGTQTFPNRPFRSPEKNVGGAALYVNGEVEFYTGPVDDLGDSAAVWCTAEF